MGYIHCCSALQKTRTFVLCPKEDSPAREMDFLEKCPVCGKTVLQITAADKNNNIITHRYVNKKAKEKLKKMELQILYEEKFFDYSKTGKGTFYLNYNEFGVKKRCYSNITNLKIGLNSTY